jgi:hypothetical protein
MMNTRADADSASRPPLENVLTTVIAVSGTATQNARDNHFDDVFCAVAANRHRVITAPTA